MTSAVARCRSVKTRVDRQPLLTLLSRLATRMGALLRLRCVHVPSRACCFIHTPPVCGVPRSSRRTRVLCVPDERPCCLWRVHGCGLRPSVRLRSVGQLCPACSCFLHGCRPIPRTLHDSLIMHGMHHSRGSLKILSCAATFVFLLARHDELVLTGRYVPSSHCNHLSCAHQRLRPGECDAFVCARGWKSVYQGSARKLQCTAGR